MIELIEKNEYVDRDLSTFSTNLGLPRHRWYEFKEGFSETLVREAISEVSTKHSQQIRLLDPFCGSGTTLVTAGRLGHRATGVEVNPFLAFASRAKCSASNWDREDFFKSFENLMKDSGNEIASPLEGQSTFTEAPDNDKWLFNRSVLRGFTALDTSLSRFPTYREPLRLALFASLMDCCNARRDGKCLRYKKGWENYGYNSTDLRKLFEVRANMVVNDITKYPFTHEDINVLNGDSRQRLSLIEDDSHDLVVTSPPYLNSFDYSDVYRPELFVGGFVKDNEELRQIRLKTVRSHVQVAWEAATEVTSTLLPPILEQISSKSLWNRRLPEMVQSYFADMAEVLMQLARVVRANGQAWIVVSTSAYGGVEIPVDLILADIGTRYGWKLKGVYVLRQLRASTQHYSHLTKNSKPPLRESLIILKR